MTPPPINFMKEWLSELSEGKEAEERGYVLLDVNDPNFEYRKLYDNTAITKEELENLVRKELANEKRKTIVQKTRK